MRVRYTDGPDAVEVHTKKGLVVVERLKPVDLPISDARQLIASGDSWEHVLPKKPAKPTPEPEPEKGVTS